MEPAGARTTGYELSDAEAIEKFLVDAYGTSMKIRSDDDPHLLRHQRTTAGSFALESAYQSAELEFSVEPLNSIVVTRTSTSRLERAVGGADRRYGAGELFLMSHPDRPYAARWLPGEIENCIIDPALMARAAAPSPARQPAPLRFTSLDPITPAAADQWWAARTYAASLLASPEAVTPLLIGAVAGLLTAATLSTFPNTAVTEPTIVDRRDAHPATLRRAVAFIDENAQADISVADVAVAANVSIRAVQLVFRRHLGITPLDYLRRVRLEHAHRDLIAADPARETVTAIAYRWGFSSSSHFSRYYREAYGVTPGRVLHG